MVVVMCMLANLSMDHYGDDRGRDDDVAWQASSCSKSVVLHLPVCCDGGHGHGGGVGAANRDPIVLLHLPHDDHGRGRGGHDVQLYVFLFLYGPRTSPLISSHSYFYSSSWLCRSLMQEVE